MAVILYDAMGNPFALSITYDALGGAILALSPGPPSAGPIVAGVSGWTVSQIVQEVDGRTEGRASNKKNFNMRMEFFLGLDEFCQEKHYWWRHKLFSFQTVVGTLSYDLSSNQPGNG